MTAPGFSPLLVFTVCLMYGLMSALSTFTMKRVYSEYPSFRSPACMLLG